MGIVTISREVGSFGDEIAEHVAKKLNFTLIDRSTIHQLVKECDLDFSKACAAYEEEVKPHGFFERISFSNPSYTARFFSLNYEAAGKGNVVIVGRGAQVTLSNVPGVLKVRVIAPLDVRVERIMKRMELPRDEALEYVESYGAERQALIHAIYGKKDPYKPSLFDLIVNTAAFDLDDAVEIVETAARRLMASSDKNETSKLLKRMAFAKEVESIIKKDVSTLPSRDLTVEINDKGEAVLNGLVLDKRSREKAEKVAAGIDGVTKVVNNLKTTTLSF
jgi:cytidylate kinase